MFVTFLVGKYHISKLATAEIFLGAQWLSGSVLDSRLRGHGSEPLRRHCVVVSVEDIFILA